MRSARDYLYIRNYQPDLWPAGTGSENTNRPGQWFADCDGGPTKQYIFDNREKDEAHARAFRLSFAKRPAEELYYLPDDPDQVDNLAGDPEKAEVLKQLGARLDERLEALNDPRATDPETTVFDGHPHFGGGGGKK